MCAGCDQDSKGLGLGLGLGLSGLGLGLVSASLVLVSDSLVLVTSLLKCRQLFLFGQAADCSKHVDQQPKLLTPKLLYERSATHVVKVF